MADDDEKTKKTPKQASDTSSPDTSSSKEEKSLESTSPEGDASKNSPGPGVVTLSPEGLERLRRKLKAKYH